MNVFEDIGDEGGVMDMDISEDEIIALEEPLNAQEPKEPEEPYPVTCNKCNEEFNGYDLDWSDVKKVYLETKESLGGLIFYSQCIECPECGERGISNGEVTLG